MNRRRITILLLLIIVTITFSAVGSNIDYEALRYIESRGQRTAHNVECDARGLYQITPVVLEAWNDRHPNRRYDKGDLFDPRVNEEIARWYMDTRIPEMLRHYGVPVNTYNKLWAYYAGIINVVNENHTPAVQEYIQNYFSATKR